MKHRIETMTSDNKPLQGKVYAVTGAASGIGAATAERIAQAGAAGILLGDLNVEALEKSAAQCECRPLILENPPNRTEWVVSS